jgi:hypothetical protein
MTGFPVAAAVNSEAWRGFLSWGAKSNTWHPKAGHG